LGGSGALAPDVCSNYKIIKMEVKMRIVEKKFI
jgi:hypothetical protein